MTVCNRHDRVVEIDIAVIEIVQHDLDVGAGGRRQRAQGRAVQLEHYGTGGVGRGIIMASGGLCGRDCCRGGVGMDDVVKSTVHLATLADFAEFNEAYKEFFSEPYPVRTTVGSELDNILVEIDVVAALPQA